MKIKELKTKAQVAEAYPVMKQLRPHLSEEEYLARVERAAQLMNYRLLALYEEGKPVAAVGFLPRFSINQGDHVWVEDLVTDENHRSKGYGQLLLTEVEKWGIENGLGTISLSSGLQRENAHRFYEDKMEYKKSSYLFRKTLR
ncbi:GNAT family N-acetyltransferase [Bacillus gobiensis]|uniref:GNAT family N-acetyltransferase n=1 Tax=Bacillus gobiensis TaxID=1441095 RepID=UPI003D1D2C10